MSAYTCMGCLSSYPERVRYCMVCGAAGLVGVMPVRPRSEALSGGVEVATAADLARLAWEKVASRAYPELVLGRGAVVLLYGAPGSGKSSMATRLANGLPGAVLYYSTEEGVGPALAARLDRLGVRRRDFHLVARGSVDDVVAEARRARAMALVVDSVTASTLTPDDLRRLASVAGVQLVVGVQQVNSRGVAAGRVSFQHESDVVVLVDALRWRLVKSRYQQVDGAEYAVLAVNDAQSAHVAEGVEVQDGDVDAGSGAKPGCLLLLPRGRRGGGQA